MKVIYERMILKTAGVLLLCWGLAVSAFAVPFRVGWGGPGYDDTANPPDRFVAYLDPSRKVIQISVNTYETSKEVSLIRLVPFQGQQEIKSDTCRKTSRHLKSPWECSFLVSDIKKLSDLGMIIVENEIGQNILTDDIDFDQINLMIMGEGQQPDLQGEGIPDGHY